MACLHGKTTSYNLLEGIYANAVAQEVERFCVESCNGCQTGHPSQRQHDCLMMNENERWQMYVLQAIERVNGKRMVWNEFAEAMRVLKLAVDRDVLEHLQQLEKDPDSTFVDSLMELYQNTENHEYQGTRHEWTCVSDLLVLHIKLANLWLPSLQLQGETSYESWQSISALL
jgi:hypothetical protein